MTVRMRHTRSHTGNRRSHHALKPGTKPGHCSHCNAVIVSHTVCKNCGYYRGRQVIDVMAKLSKKEKKQKEKALQSGGEAA